ncbi:unnamed protein product [Polarella glacialis]|uniref:PPM-type phosphatase domain-containing protein n=1 Tax=Polarella glacialis TaxID=89957 RepID=A0A813GQL2_POLGL|nr:unnamed protein product [Polarella glacialis]|mmetsp:Transcript_40343/g.73067  ORF Transcript_40343/g.73067 Transcript_40343/m.73067 type:complete len:347 (+) Transcript_40343:158-1198(+)
MSRFVGGRRGSGTPSRKESVPEAEADLVSVVSCGLPDILEECKRKVPKVRVLVAHYSAKNWGGRHENEDRFMDHQDVIGSHGEPRLGFHTVGVLDGHDTESASDTVSRLLPASLGKRLKAGQSIHDAYVETMAEMEESLKKVHASAGTCVNSCLIAGRHVWCANLGDCRSALILLEEPAVAGAGAKASRLTWMSRDHKASMPYERKRILDLGGTVTDGRVEGLEPSRTLGDFDVKLSTKSGVISIIPEVRQFELCSNGDRRHAVLVCGTDGVWDVLSGQDICDLIHARKDLGKLAVAKEDEVVSKAGLQALRDLAEDVVQYAVAKGSRDDCTCVATMISVFPHHES